MDDAHGALDGALEDDLGGLQEDDGVDGGVEVGGVAVADNQDLGLASLFRQRTVSMEDQEDTAFLDHLPLGDPDDEELLSTELAWAAHSTTQEMSFGGTQAPPSPLVQYGSIPPASSLPTYTQLPPPAAPMPLATMSTTPPHNQLLSHPLGSMPAAQTLKVALSLEELEARMMAATFNSHPHASSSQQPMPLESMYLQPAQQHQQQQPRQPQQQQPPPHSPYAASTNPMSSYTQQQLQHQLLKDPAILASSHTPNSIAPLQPGMQLPAPSAAFSPAHLIFQRAASARSTQAPPNVPPAVHRSPVPPLALHLARQHEGMLSPHGLMLSPHTTMLAPHSALLSPHSALHSPHAAIISPHSAMHSLGHAPPTQLPLPTSQLPIPFLQTPLTAPLQRPPRPPTRTPPGFGPQDSSAAKPTIPRLVFKTAPVASSTQPPPPPTPSPRTLAAAAEGSSTPRDGGRVLTPRVDDQQRLHHPSPRQQLQHNHHLHTHGGPQRRHPGSLLMSADEIESILRIQYMATHGGTPYQEDHYYQAYLHKLRGNRPSRSVLFAPATLRDITNPDANAHTAAVRVVGLDGLGTIVLSNIRTPKMLMDLASGPSASQPHRSSSGGKLAGGSESGGSKARPLEQEPLLAARMMIEDCMSLLLDIDDIDRTFAAAVPHGRGDAGELRNRRWMLVKGIITSFRLPTHPVPQLEEQAEPGAGTRADGIFLRVMALPKGRSFLARTLRLLFPPTASLDSGSLAPHADMVLTVLWALLRNARTIYTLPAGPGTAHTAADLRGPCSHISSTAAEVVRKLDSAQAVAQSLQALTQGSLTSWTGGEAATSGLLPLLPPPLLDGVGHAAYVGSQQAWLADVVAALMLRASELGLDKSTGGVGEDEQGLRAGDELGAASELWRAHFQHFLSAMHRHLDELATLWHQAQAQQDKATAASVQSISPVQLVRTMLPHCSMQQQALLRAALSRVTQY